MPYVVRQGLSAFLSHEYPPIEMIIEPWLPTNGLAMIAGYRGVSKTFFTLSVALAIATGGEFLGWRADKPRRVLYVDGEMNPRQTQERVAALSLVHGRRDLADKNFHLLSWYDQTEGLVSLMDPLGQDLITEALGDGQVLIVDNLSAVARASGSENADELVLPLNDYWRYLRKQDKTVLMLHHTGKPRAEGPVSQRGTSKREDLLDTTILLSPAKGRQVKVTADKSRGFDAWEPFHYAIDWPGSDPKVPCRIERAAAVKEAVDDEVDRMLEEGKHWKEINKATGVSRTQIFRRKSKQPKGESDE